MFGKANPEGIKSFSPGLRRSRYPGFSNHNNATLKGLYLPFA
jgi:hypothetical protein